MNQLYTILTRHLRSPRRHGALIVLLFIFSHVQGQNLEPLGAGSAQPVYCSCTDDAGNLYAVSKNKSSDTMVVNKWNTAQSSWSVFAKMDKMFAEGEGFVPQCVFYRNTFYLNAVYSVSSSDTLSELYELDTNRWNLVGTFNMVKGAAISMINFDNKLYISGQFDSVKGPFSGGQVAVYDGVSITNAGFPSSYIPGTYDVSASEMAISNDTLFMSFNEQVLFHKAPSTWGTYYTHRRTVNTIATLNTRICVADIEGNIYQIRMNKILDSLRTGKPNIRLKVFRDRIYLTHENSLNDPSERIAEYTGNRLVYYVVNGNQNTQSGSALLNYSNQELYYFNRNGVFSAGREYHYIARTRDTMIPLTYDTIYISVFKDKDANNLLDSSVDESAPSYIEEVNSQTGISTDNQGNAVLYPLEDEDMKLRFSELLQGSQDSCYGPVYSGTKSSRTYNSPLTRDTLYFPLRPVTRSNRNLILKTWSSSRARILDTITLNFDVYSRDCFNMGSSAKVSVNLDSNVDIIKSDPPYTSRVGSQLTYDLHNIGNYITNVKLMVRYSNLKYKAGHIVRHQASLSTTFTEDAADNADSIVQKLVYSYDPNEKHSTPEGKIKEDVKSIRYHIDFQNMGNDDARRVTVVDTLNLNMPVYEFQMISSSHPYGQPSFRGNVVTWVFNNINLKPKSENEAASKGFIIFDARVRGHVKKGDSIMNKAYIYFDYNEPVITNNAVIIRRDDTETIKGYKRYSSLKVFPNPASRNIAIENQYTVKQELDLYDMKGALMKKIRLEGLSSCTLDASSWARGIYLLVSDSGDVVQISIE